MEAALAANVSGPNMSLFRYDFAQNPATTWFTTENTLARLGWIRRILSGNTPNRHLQVVLDSLFDLARAVPVREGKAAVDFRLVGILGREEIVKLFLRIDHASMSVAKLFWHGRRDSAGWNRGAHGARLTNSATGRNSFALTG